MPSQVGYSWQSWDMNFSHLMSGDEEQDLLSTLGSCAEAG